MYVRESMPMDYYLSTVSCPKKILTKIQVAPNRAYINFCVKSRSINRSSLWDLFKRLPICNIRSGLKNPTEGHSRMSRFQGFRFQAGFMKRNISRESRTRLCLDSRLSRQILFVGTGMTDGGF